MRLKFFLLVSIALFVTVAGRAYATENATSSPTTSVSATTTPKPSTHFRDELKNARQDFRTSIPQIREEFMDAMKAKRGEFMKRLATIKDEKKKEIVERISNKIEETNKKVIDRFVDVLEKLQALLTRISGKAKDAKVKGLDTNALDVAITNAQKTIDAAKAAVSAQAGKGYVVEIGSETGLKNTVGKTVSQFRQDLSAVHKSIMAAKQAVRKAATELAKLISGRGINHPEKNATESGSGSTSATTE